MAERYQSATPTGATSAVTVSGSYMDWAAILAGAVVASAIAFVFATFGAALGLSALSAQPGEGSGQWGTVIVGAWALVTLVVSYLAGGYIAGRFRRRVESATEAEVHARDGVHGLTVWGIGTIIAAILLSSAVSTTAKLAGSAVSTAAQAGSAVVSGAASVAGGAAQGVSNLLPEQLQNDPTTYITDRLFRGAGGNGTPQISDQQRQEVQTILYNVVKTGDISDGDRQYLTGLVAQNSNLSQEEVNQRIDQAVQGVQDARQQVADTAAEAEQTARDAADTARRAGVISGFVIAASLLVAAAAAYVGAGIGGHHREDGRVLRGFAPPPRR